MLLDAAAAARQLFSPVINKTVSVYQQRNHKSLCLMNRKGQITFKMNYCRQTAINPATQFVCLKFINVYGIH